MQIKTRNVGRWLLVGILVASAAGIQIWRLSQQRAAETASAAILRDLGAIVGMDGTRQHVVNVNLNVIPDPAKRAQGIEALQGLRALTSLDLQDTVLSPAQVGTISHLRNFQRPSVSRKRNVALLN